MLQKDFTQILIRSKRKQVNNSQICYLKISKRLMIKTGNPVQSYKKNPQMTTVNWILEIYKLLTH